MKTMQAKQRALAFTCGQTDAASKRNWDKVAAELREKLKKNVDYSDIKEVIEETDANHGSTNFQKLMRDMVMHGKQALPENKINCLQYVQLYVKPGTNIVCFSPTLTKMSEKIQDNITIPSQGAQRRRVLTILYAKACASENWWVELDFTQFEKTGFWSKFRNLSNNIQSKRTFWHNAIKQDKAQYKLVDKMLKDPIVQKFQTVKNKIKKWPTRNTKADEKLPKLQRTMALIHCLIQLELRCIQLEQAGQHVFQDKNVSLLNIDSENTN